jgi:isoleucyl-tRNA synthetase
LVREAAQSFLLPLWNALSFFTIYANLDQWTPGADSVPFERRPALDRWILLRLDRLVEDTTGSLEGFRVWDAARCIEIFIDDLTNWYIRRSRDRFWAPAAEAGESKESAYQTLYEVLCSLARVIAPFTPFVAEILHRNLVRSQPGASAESVHLEAWPRPVAQRVDITLEAGMAAVQRVVRLGHAARNSHGLKTRQPLASVTLVTTEGDLPALVEPHLEVLREELNVREVLWASDRSAYVHHEVRPNYPRCGPRFGKQMATLKTVLEAADGDTLAAQLEDSGRITLELDGETVELSPEELEVRMVEQEETASQGDRELLVVLDTHLSEDLIAEGWAREVIHRIQTARKEADLDYADRIRVRYRTEPALASAIDRFQEWICRETLAVELTPLAEDSSDLAAKPVEEMDFRFAIQRSAD